MKEIGSADRKEAGRQINNRAENSISRFDDESGQRDERDVGGNAQASRKMSSGKGDGVRARRDLRGDLGHVQVHRLGDAGRHNQGGGLALLRTDRAENVGRGGSLVAWALGRVPRLAQRWVVLFFWPIRASSTNQISMVWGPTPFSRRPMNQRKAAQP
jgi:hypothetical protein